MAGLSRIQLLHTKLMVPLLAGLACAASLCAPSAHAQQFSIGSQYTPPPATNSAARSTFLNANRIENIYAGFGKVTTLELKSQAKVDQILLGLPIVKINYNKELNSIDIIPVVQSGQTNMNLTVGGNTYVFMLNIVEDPNTPINFRKTYTLPGELGAAENAAVSASSPLKPHEVDIAGAIRMIEESQVDSVLRTSIQGLRTIPAGKTYQWNDNLIHFVDINHFLAEDLIVLRVMWQNTTGRAYYLSAQQIEPWIANKKISVTAYTQDKSTVMPGEMDTIYLFIQGYRLAADNNWELKLPAEASAVRRLFAP